jgi:hypothetical protein
VNTKRPRLSLPSPALIISCLALFAALGGGAYAAASANTTTVSWHNATLGHGWKRYGPTYAPAGYTKDANGIVHLKGGISGGSSGTTAFVLPRGYRPSHDLGLPVYTYIGTEGSLSIYPNGDVQPSGSDAGAYTGLDGVSFAAGE